MANSLGSVAWGSNPAITISFSYDYQRSGANMQYQIYGSVAPLTKPHYFGYPIYMATYLDGAMVNAAEVKPQRPDTWTTPYSYASGWHSVSGKTSGTTSLSINVYSGAGSSRNEWYSFSLYVSPAQSSIASVQPFNVEDAFSVTVTKYSTDFVDNLTISLDGKIIKSLSNYTSGEQIRLNNSELLDVYNAMADRTQEFTFALSSYSGSDLVGTSTATAEGTIAGTVRLRLASAWTRALVWRNVNGVWKRSIANIKSGGEWRRGT